MQLRQFIKTMSSKQFQFERHIQSQGRQKGSGNQQTGYQRRTRIQNQDTRVFVSAMFVGSDVFWELEFTDCVNLTIFRNYKFSIEINSKR